MGSTFSSRSTIAAIAITAIHFLWWPLAAANASVQAPTTTAVLRGVVRLETGERLSGVVVSVAETGDNLFSSLLTTAADGAFAVTVPQGTYSITVFGATASKTPSDLLDNVHRGVIVDEGRDFDLAVLHGAVVQTCVLSQAGVPLPGARIDVFDEVNEITRTVIADGSGWVRFVSAPGQSLLVTPPQVPSRDVSRWFRFEDLVLGDDGIALPIRLDTLDAPVDDGSQVVTLHRGRAPGRHVKIVLLAEAFTAIDEPFDDKNHNGVCDDEPYLDRDGNGRFNAGDLFIDANRNGKRDTEPFTDTNNDGICNRGERDLFLQSATDELRGMFGFPVYRELYEYVDVFAAFTPSNQAGSDYPSLPVPVVRDTAFDSRFLSLNFIFNYDDAKLTAVARQISPDYDLLGLITYNPFGTGVESGGGTVRLFASRQTNVDFTCAHEFGHSLGRLADEYFSYDGAPAYAGVEPGYPNVTKDSSLGELKWIRFLRPGTTVPTLDGTPGAGVFEGAYYHRHGASRPSYNCMMRKAGPFCPVCAESLTAQAAAIRDATRPASPTLAAPLEGDTVTDALLVGIDTADLAIVDIVQPLVDGYAIGPPVRMSPFSAELDVSRSVPGAHSISAEVRFSDGHRTVTPAVHVSFAPSAVSTPTTGVPRFSGGTLVLVGPAGVVAGAELFVDGVDRYPLEAASDGSIRVVKTAEGSASALLFRKAVKRGRQVQITVVNPDGGRSAPAPFVRMAHR